MAFRERTLTCETIVGVAVLDSIPFQPSAKPIENGKESVSSLSKLLYLQCIPLGWEGADLGWGETFSEKDPYHCMPNMLPDT